MTTHTWRVLTHKESMWVKWVYEYRLKGKSLWEVNVSANASWGWRKLLRIRNKVRPFIFSVVRDGNSTSAWFDTWSNIRPLHTFISCRDIANAGFSM